MNRFVRFCAATAFMLGCSSGAVGAETAVQAGQWRLERVASLDISYLKNGWPTVPVTIGGAERQMILALQGDSAVSDALASDLRLRRLGPDNPWHPPLIAIMGLPAYNRVILPDLRIGLAHSSNVEMYVAGSSLSGRVYQLPDGADGVIGTTLLKHFDVELDLASNKLNLYFPGHCGGGAVYWARSYAAVPLEFDPIGDVVFHMDLDGKTVMVIPSFQASSAIMGATTAKQVFDLKADSPLAVPDPGEDSKSFTYPFQSLSIGGLTINNPTIHIVRDGGYRCEGQRENLRICFGGADVRLGLSELRQLHMLFSFAEKTLYLTPASGEPRRLGESAAEIQPAPKPRLLPVLPIRMQCSNPSMDAVFVKDGPVGYATAKLTLDINSDGDADALKITPSSPAVCQLGPTDKAVIASASFSLTDDRPGPDAQQECKNASLSIRAARWWRAPGRLHSQ